MKKKTFTNFEDISSFIQQYETKSDNHLIVQKSNVGLMQRRYICATHKNCPFYMVFGEKRGADYIIVKNINTQHSGEPKKDKTRKKIRVLKTDSNKAIDTVLNTKQDAPTAGDVVKSMTHINQTNISYHLAYDHLKKRMNMTEGDILNSFQMIIPFLQSFATSNQGATVEVEKENGTHHLQRIFLCPGFVNNNLQYVRPVISCDACHLKSKHKGMLYMFTCLSGKNEVYILAFGIASGNEDENNWSWMLKNFSKACPNINLPRIKRTDTPSQNDTSAEDIPEYKFNEILFVSDRDKGLGKAFDKILPNNLCLNCAVHIKANVCQKYGKACSETVLPISKSYSTQDEDFYLQKLKEMNESAFNYVEGIEKNRWRSTEWVQMDSNLPPRYRIVSSNTSESANSMILKFRELSWMECIKSIVEYMCKSIANKRELHKKNNQNECVPFTLQMLNKRFQASLKVTIFEREANVAEYTCFEDRNTSSTNQQVSTATIVNILRPDQKRCSCGKWQDFKIPCRHAIAYFCKEHLMSVESLGEIEVHWLYKYWSLHALYKKNISPVIVDHLRKDGQTLPPKVHVPTGRPKKKRIRNRSEFGDPSESTIHCSICKQAGHNKRSCTLIAAMKK